MQHTVSGRNARFAHFRDAGSLLRVLARRASWRRLASAGIGCIAACTALLVATPAFASGTDQLRQFVSQVHSARGEFVQTEIRSPSKAQSASGAQPTQMPKGNTVSSGTFSFARPGKFIWQYQKPYE